VQKLELIFSEMVLNRSKLADITFRFSAQVRYTKCLANVIYISAYVIIKKTMIDRPKYIDSDIIIVIKLDVSAQSTK